MRIATPAPAASDLADYLLGLVYGALDAEASWKSAAELQAFLRSGLEGAPCAR